MGSPQRKGKMNIWREETVSAVDREGMARNTGHCVRTGLNIVGTFYIDMQL